MHRLPTLLQRLQATKARRVKVVDDLETVVQGFRDVCFQPELPCMLPAADPYSLELTSTNQLSAGRKWFKSYEPAGKTIEGGFALHSNYLRQYGEAAVPLELTQHKADNTISFHRFDAPLGSFLDHVDAVIASQNSDDATPKSDSQAIYLAQCPISSLPRPLQDDLPTPLLVRSAGKGDVYDANIWIGMPPTYTPLHKDPNPNLFLQLAGSKVIRVFTPALGLELYDLAQRRVGAQGSPTIRGDEMMQGAEREVLEGLVWDDGNRPKAPSADVEFEVHVQAGDAVFIPKGWWHSIKSIGGGVSASVNWWFR